MRKGDKTIGSTYNELVLLRRKGKSVDALLFKKAVDDFSKMIDYSQGAILTKGKETKEWK